MAFPYYSLIAHTEQGGNMTENALTKLISPSAVEREKLGVLHTASEIADQVNLWENSSASILEKTDQLLALIRSSRDGNSGCIMCAGAGTSEFIGYCIEGLLRKRLCLPVNVFSTTRIVTTPGDIFFEGARPLLLSFARSGNSPESIGAVRIAEMNSSSLHHAVVTCNRNGELFRWASQSPNAVPVCLHEKTDDRGLAMTSSFTNMLVAGQTIAFLESVQEYRSHLEKLVTAGEALLRKAPDSVEEISKLDFNRAVFLGNGAGWGTAVESHLKLQELTSGRVMCAYETFLGLRHGPEALIDDRTLVIAFLSSDPYLRKYEENLLGELTEKHIGMATLACGQRLDGSILKLTDYAVDFDPEGRLEVPDDLLPPVQVILGQLLGLFKSLNLGLKPDTPSTAGVIHRVVEGVRIYDPLAFSQTGQFKIIAER
jgi:tagatose-6-phosphate ketose/aldose isomerase